MLGEPCEPGLSGLCNAINPMLTTRNTYFY
jgi:hypothetical protein